MKAIKIIVAALALTLSVLTASNVVGAPMGTAEKDNGEF